MTARVTINDGQSVIPLAEGTEAQRQLGDTTMTYCLDLVYAYAPVIDGAAPAHGGMQGTIEWGGEKWSVHLAYAIAKGDKIPDVINQPAD